MKKLNLISFFVALIFLVSCEKDSDQILSPNDNLNLELRAGGNGDCMNFVRNGDFSEHIYNNLNDCNLAFQNGLVTSWTNAFGTPDLVYQECFPNCTANVDYAQLATNLANQYYEGILTDVNVVAYPDVIYTLCMDAGAGSPTSQIEIISYLANGLTSAGPNPATSNNLPNQTNTLEVLRERPGYAGNECVTPFNGISSDFKTTVNYSQLVIYSSHPSSFGVGYVDNIELTCRSEYLEGITVVDNGNCNFSFSPQLGGQLTVTEYEWDFGGQGTSDIENPSFTFGSGTHTVTLTITDDRGCCTTVDVGVSCNDDPCIYYLCWEELQGVDFFDGFTVDGTYYDFNPNYYIVGNYGAIRDNMLNQLQANGVDYGTFMSNHADYDCLKSNNAGTNSIPGYFFIDSPNEIESFKVFFEDGSLGTVPFNQVNCN